MAKRVILSLLLSVLTYGASSGMNNPADSIGCETAQRKCESRLGRQSDLFSAAVEPRVSPM